MTRVLVVVVVLLAASGIAVLGGARQAFACTGPGPIENMLDSTVILEGRIVSVVRVDGPVSDQGLLPHTMTLAVVKAHKGTSDGATLTARAYIPGPAPTMCPQFPRDVSQLVGKYVVMGLEQDREAYDYLRADAWVTPFMGAALEGDDYMNAAALARMISDSDGTSAVLTVGSTATCGEPLRFTGRNFRPGKYLLRGSTDSRVLAVFDVGTSGTFDVTTKFIHGLCRSYVDQNGRTVAFHIFDLGLGVPWVYLNVKGLVEIGLSSVAGSTMDTNWQEPLQISPGPFARCDDTLTITGSHLEPFERLTLYIGEVAMGAVTPDGAGRFVAVHAIPAASCQNQEIVVRLTQTDFEPYNAPGISVAARSVFREGLAAQVPPASNAGSPTPAPPIVGSGAAMRARATTSHEVFVLAGAMFVASAMFVGASLFAIRR